MDSLDPRNNLFEMKPVEMGEDWKITHHTWIESMQWLNPERSVPPKDRKFVALVLTYTGPDYDGDKLVTLVHWEKGSTYYDNVEGSIQTKGRWVGSYPDNYRGGIQKILGWYPIPLDRMDDIKAPKLSWGNDDGT